MTLFVSYFYFRPKIMTRRVFPTAGVSLLPASLLCQFLSQSSSHVFFNNLHSLFLPFFSLFPLVSLPLLKLFFSSSLKRVRTDLSKIPLMVDHQLLLVSIHFSVYRSVYCRVIFEHYEYFSELHSPYIVYFYWPILCSITYFTSDIYLYIDKPFLHNAISLNLFYSALIFASFYCGKTINIAAI